MPSMEIHRIPGLMAYAYLIETADALFLVDGGMAGTGRKILKRIAEIGRKPQELLFAVVTHAHADHFGGLEEVQEATGCAIICHPEHEDTVRSGGNLVSPGLNIWAKIYERIAHFALPKMRLPRLKRVLTVEDGTDLHALGLPGRVLHTPGHSHGDITLVLDDGSAFVGDLVQGRRIPNVTPPEFSIMAVDEPAMISSWRKLIESGAKRIYPGHGTIGHIAELLPVFRRRVARQTRRARRLKTAASHQG